MQKESSDIHQKLEYPKDDKFLNTACRFQMNSPVATLVWLEMDFSEENSTTNARVRTANKTIEAKTFQVKTKVNLEQQRDLKALGVKYSESILRPLTNEFFGSLKKHLADKYNDLGEKHETLSWGKWKNFLRKNFKTEFFQYVKNSHDLEKILQKRAAIVVKHNRRKRPNFVIMSPKLLAIAQDSTAFYSDMTTKYDIPEMISYEGNIHDLAIFVNRHSGWDDDSLVIGCTTDQNCPGVFFGEYSLDFHENIAPDGKFFEMTTRGRLCLSDIGDRPELNFWKDKVVVGKKPIWRKLLKI